MKSPLKRILITEGVIFIFTFSFFLIRLYIYPEWSIKLQFALLGIQFLVLSLIWELNRQIHYLLNKYYPFTKNIFLRLVLQIIIPALILIFIHWIAFEYVHLFFQIPILEYNLFKKFIYLVDLILTATIQLSYISIYFFKNWKESLYRAERLEREKAQIHYDKLKNQLNPHFLFNNLTLIDSLIHENPKLASEFINQLAQVYRYILDNKELVSVKKEVDFIEHYIQLIETRYENAIQVELKINESDFDKMLVPTLFQNLIDNALKHNIATEKNPLNIRINSNGTHIIIQNNIQLKKSSFPSNRQGLNQLKSLYSYMTSSPIEVVDDQSSFIVKIPFIEP